MEKSSASVHAGEGMRVKLTGQFDVERDILIPPSGAYRPNYMRSHAKSGSGDPAPQEPALPQTFSLFVPLEVAFETSPNVPAAVASRRQVSKVSISAGVLSVRIRAMRGKRRANPL